MLDTHSQDRLKGQPQNQHRLGAALDASEFAQIEREVVFGRPAHLDYQLDDGSCADDCPDCKHRDLRRRYRAHVRKRVIARGHKDGRRIGDMRALEIKLDTAVARFNDTDRHLRIINEMGDIAPAPRTEREHIDLAAEIEAIKIDIDELASRNHVKRSQRRTLYAGGLACQ